jgi:hypothetical protein
VSDTRAKWLEKPAVLCSSTVDGRPCRRRAVFTSGRCTACEEREARNPFAVLDSYLPGIRGEA